MKPFSHRRLTALTIAACLSLAGWPHLRAAQPGSVDTTFSANLDFPQSPVLGITASGEILAGGSGGGAGFMGAGSLVRLQTGGQRDGTFADVQLDGPVMALLVQPDGRIVLGGGFTRVLAGSEVARNRLVRFNADGTLDATFDPGTGATDGPLSFGGDVTTVAAIVGQPDGKLIVAGNFTRFNGQARQRIVRLNSDGSVDPAFNPGQGADDLILTLALQGDGRILIGGFFTQVSGTLRRGIARLNSDASLDSSFNPGTGIAGGPVDFIGNLTSVRAVAVQPDGRILVGGFFTRFNEFPRQRLARLHPDGSLDATFNAGITGGHTEGATDYTVVGAIRLQPDGRILIGGDFNAVSDLPRSRVARLYADGVPDANFDPGSGPNDFVERINLQPDGRVLIGGVFFSVDGISRFGVARLLGGDPATAPPVFTIQPAGRTVTAGSTVTLVSEAVGLPRPVYQWHVDGAPISGATNPVLRLNNAEFVHAGTYTVIASNALGSVTSNPAVLTVNPGPVAPGLLDATFYPGAGANGPVLAVARQDDGRVLIAGGFTQVDGVGRNRIARLHADGSLDTGFDPGTGADGIIHAVELQRDGQVLIGGEFTTFNGVPRDQVARLHADGALDESFNPATGAPRSACRDIAYALALQRDGRLVAGGLFTTFNGRIRNRIRRHDTDGTLDVSFDTGAGANNVVRALAVQPDGRVLIGGFFTFVNGVARRHVARLHPDGSLDDSFAGGTLTNVAVRAIAVQPDGRMLVGGGVAVQDEAGPHAPLPPLLVRLQGDGTLDASFNPGAGVSGGSISAGGGGGAPVNETAVHAILVRHDGTILIGGNFTNYNGALRRHIARLLPDGALDTSFDSADGANGSVHALCLQPDHRLLIAGRFTAYNGVPRAGIARLHGSAPGPFAPVIAQQPASRSAFTGSQVTFAVEAEGNPAPTYQWLLNGEEIANADGPTLTLDDVQPAAAGDYSVEVRNAGGTNTSQTATLTVSAPPPPAAPQIVTPPAGQTVITGFDARFEVSASGFPPPVYQWRFEGADLPGATNATLQMRSVQPAHAGAYTVIVSNALGSVTGGPATLAVAAVPPATAPVITGQPAGQTAAPGTDVVLEVAASGFPPPAIQWRLNGVDIAGATSTKLLLRDAQPGDSGRYSAVAVNPAGSAHSAIADVVITAPALAFADNVADRVLVTAPSGTGSGDSRTATAESGEPEHAGKTGGRSLWLGWQSGTAGIATFRTRGSGFDTVLAVYTNATPGAAVNVANLASIVADDDQGGFFTSEVVFNVDAGREYLVAVDGFGGVGGDIVLEWEFEETTLRVPRITDFLDNQTVIAGSSVVFGIEAQDTASLTYQWFFNCEPIPGANTPALPLFVVQPDDVGRYSVRVSNGQREIESPPALLQLNTSGDGGTAQKVASRDKLADRIVVAPDPPPEGAARVAALTAGGGAARGFTGTQVFHTFGSTREIGEPLHCGVAGGASAWFTVQAEADGTMLVTTEGSDFDTVLAVYAGPPNPLSFGQLTEMACDNDGGADGRTSRLTFAATQGQTYHIAVDGVGGASGRVQLAFELSDPPGITMQPDSLSASAGGLVSFEVSTTAARSLTYQWQFNGTDLAGANQAALTFSSVHPTNAGIYRVIVRNFAGTVTSDSVVLTVGGPLQFGARTSVVEGLLQLEVLRQAGLKVVVEASPDLVNWTPVVTNTTADVSFSFTDPGSAGQPRRFYRAFTIP